MIYLTPQPLNCSLLCRTCIEFSLLVTYGTVRKAAYGRKYLYYFIWQIHNYTTVPSCVRVKKYIL